MGCFWCRNSPKGAFSGQYFLIWWWRIVQPFCYKTLRVITLAAAAAGADGLIIEVHNDPKHALCDGAQSLTPDEFADVAARVQAVRSCIG